VFKGAACHGQRQPKVGGGDRGHERRDTHAVDGEQRHVARLGGAELHSWRTVVTGRRSRLQQQGVRGAEGKAHDGAALLARAVERRVGGGGAAGVEASSGRPGGVAPRGVPAGERGPGRGGRGA
jgi:hypothetical protein